MEAEIRRDEAFHTGHFTDKPRHTMQLEWYGFEHELKTRSIPAGHGDCTSPQHFELIQFAQAFKFANLP